MAAVAHSNVGLMHASMVVFNAFRDRVPLLLLGATGSVDAVEKALARHPRPPRGDPAPRCAHLSARTSLARWRGWCCQWPVPHADGDGPTAEPRPRHFSRPKGWELVRHRSGSGDRPGRKQLQRRGTGHQRAGGSAATGAAEADGVHFPAEGLHRDDGKRQKLPDLGGVLAEAGKTAKRLGGEVGARDHGARPDEPPMLISFIHSRACCIRFGNARCSNAGIGCGIQCFRRFRLNTSRFSAVSGNPLRESGVVSVVDIS